MSMKAANVKVKAGQLIDIWVTEEMLGNNRITLNKKVIGSCPRTRACYNSIGRGLRRES